MDGQLEIAGSAHRHDIADDDMIHAFHHPIRVHVLDDELTMLVGPDTAGRLLEVGVVRADDGTPVIVHAMPARQKFLE